MPGTAELQSQLADLTRQAEEMQLLRNELALAKNPRARQASSPTKREKVRRETHFVKSGFISSRLRGIYIEARLDRSS